MIARLLLMLVVANASTLAIAQEISTDLSYPALTYGFPIPPETPQRLFFLQRSMNSKTVVYDANLQTDGSLNPDKPIVVYWLRYNTQDGEKPLKYLEEQFVWGVRSHPSDELPGAYEINLVSYRERTGRLALDASGRPELLVDINGRPAKLKHVFLKLAEFDYIPELEYAELFGIDSQTGAAVYEKISPNLDWGAQER